MDFTGIGFVVVILLSGIWLQYHQRTSKTPSAEIHLGILAGAIGGFAFAVEANTVLILLLAFGSAFVGMKIGRLNQKDSDR